MTAWFQSKYNNTKLDIFRKADGQELIQQMAYYDKQNYSNKTQTCITQDAVDVNLYT